MAVDTEYKQSASETEPAPLREYNKRLAERERASEELNKQLDRLGMARLIVFGAGLLIAWLAFGWQLITGWWLVVVIIPVVTFFVLLIRYAHIRRTWQRTKRAIRYYQFGLDRIGNRWQGKGNSGQKHLRESHLYGLDLDVFGQGSLFERVCSARTFSGDRTLAGWLMRPAEAEVINSRQSAVAELAPNLDLREDLALLGAEVPPVDFGALAKWGAAPVMLQATWMRFVLVVFAVLNAAAILAWLAFGFTPLITLAVFVFSGSAALLLRKRVKQVLEPIEPMGRDIFLLEGVLERIEREEFSDPMLAKLRSELDVDGHPPSWQIGKLAWLVDWLNAMKNQIFIPIGLALLWRTQMAFALEAWRKQSGPAIGKWLNAIGSLEALSSLAGYAFENPEDTYPEICEDAICFEGEEVGHPLIPKKECVHNDIQLMDPVRVLIVSGSNMSGKSTLLRTVGTNTVLALAGAPVRAKRLKLSPLAIGATLRIQDSLLAGRSRFAAEIARIRDILQRTEETLPVLFLLDELFHGTNSHDRGIGAEALVKRLTANGAIGLLTTHDLSLTHIAEKFGKAVQNVHFADQFINGKMHFDYKMTPGVVPHSNALSLMRAIGLDV